LQIRIEKNADADADPGKNLNADPDPDSCPYRTMASHVIVQEIFTKGQSSKILVPFFVIYGYAYA
jgi:hypothetical protein